MISFTHEEVLSSQEQKMTPESVISSSSKDVSESSLVAPTPKRSLSLLIMFQVTVSVSVIHDNVLWKREKFYVVILFLTYCSSSSWVQSLVIPTRFSKSCMNSIKMGVLTGHARDEIINSVATCILLFKLNPSPDEKRLINLWTLNKDHSLTERPYSPWKTLWEVDT